MATCDNHPDNPDVSDVGAGLSDLQSVKEKLKALDDKPVTQQTLAVLAQAVGFDNLNDVLPDGWSLVDSVDDSTSDFLDASLSGGQ